MLGLAGGQRCVVAALASGGDQGVGRGDLLGQTLDLCRGADGGEAGGLVPCCGDVLGGVRGLLMQLGQRREPLVDLRSERGEIGEAGGRCRLGLFGGVGELVTGLLGELLAVLRVGCTLAGALADVLVDAEGEQLDEQTLAVGRGGAQEFGEPALR